MTKQRFLLSVLCVFIIIHTFGQAPTPQWTPLVSTETMIVVAIVKAGGSDVGHDQIEVGAFSSIGCRGSAIMVYDAFFGTYVAYLTIHGSSGESFTLRLFDHSINQEYETSHIVLNFSNGAMLGMPTPVDINQTTPVSATAPDAPDNFTATPGNGQVTLTWELPPSDGGSPISGYEISYGTTTGYTTVWSIPVNHASRLTYTIPSLTNGTNYTFEVRAVNAHGQSIAAGPVNATPGAVTTYPTGFTPPSSIVQNGVTAAGAVIASNPANATVTVTILLYGTATAAGTHTVDLTSSTLGAGITAPGTVTRTVTAGENITTGNTFAFTFTMPANAVTDLVVIHTFTATPTPPVITTPPGALTGGDVGTAYSATLAATNSPTAWTVSSGALPAGLSLNNSGVISGTPTTAGTANFSVTATNADGVSAAVAFSITISAAPTTYAISASSLTSFGSLQTPYTPPAAQTVTITNTGTGTITLTQPDATNYNIGTLSATTLSAGATATFNINPKAGLPVGNHDEIITIGGTGGATATVSASFTVTTYTPPQTYTVTINAVADGSVIVDRMSAYPGETVTLTIVPHAGYTLTTINVQYNNGMDAVATKGSGTTHTFTMPAADVTVTAVFRIMKTQEKWEAAKAIIEGATFNLPQDAADSQTALRYRLTDTINELIHSTGFVISPYDIVIFVYNFRPAQAGTPENRSGTNGYFEFRVTPPNTRTSAYNDGTITATSYDDVANEQLTMNNEQLRAQTQNGLLHVSGLTPGKLWHIYNLYGQQIYIGIAEGNEAKIPLPERGIYIIRSGGKVIKTIY